MAEPRRMTPRDLLFGFPYGNAEAAARPRDVEPLSSPRETIERVLVKALARPPCVVGFSGGRDSSAVLAVATHVARREGLPEPIPVTRVYPGVAETEEYAWQRLVLDHLGLTEWARERIDDEMDLVGPLAQPRLRRHGVLWTPLLHGDEFFLRHARGGSILDGEGGDHVCDPRPHRIAPVARLVRQRRRPSRRRVREATISLAPGSLRGRRAADRQARTVYPWLRPQGVELLRESVRAHVAAEPLDARSSILMLLRRRSLVDLQANRNHFARENDSLFISPLFEPEVTRALAARAGPLGFRDRAEGLGTFCRDLLPREVLSRNTKAEFNATFFTRHSHAFAARWSGTGFDPELIDADALRTAWRGPQHNALSAALLQAAWLAEEGGSG